MDTWKLRIFNHHDNLIVNIQRLLHHVPPQSRCLNQMSAKPPSRLEYLDSIRGLAAFAVFLGHFVGFYGIPPSLAFIQTGLFSLLLDGAAAVSMFFVLSGFVLARKYFATPDVNYKRNEGLSRFFLLRCFRIYPPYLIALLLSFAAQKWLFAWPEITPAPSDFARTFWQHDVTLPQLLKDSLFLINANESPLIPQGWTLAIELKLSFLIPFLVLIAQRSVGWLLTFTVMAIGALQMQYFLWHFTLGVMLAALRSFSLLAQVSPMLKTTLKLVAGICFYLAHQTILPLLQVPPPFSLTNWIMGFGAMLLISAVLTSGRLQSFLHWAPLRQLGRISYSFYLLHMLLLLCLTPRLFHALHSRGTMGDWLIALMLTTAATIAVSMIFYQWVEKPSMKFGQKLANRFFEPKSITTASHNSALS